MKRNFISRNQKGIDELHISPKELIQKFPTKKWLIVGAGPSLDKQWQEIKAYEKDNWNIAVCDMAFWPTINHNIQPDLIFSCENKPYPFFNTTIKDCNKVKSLNRRKPSKETYVVAWAGIHPYQLNQLNTLRKLSAQLSQKPSTCFFLWEQDKVTNNDRIHNENLKNQKSKHNRKTYTDLPVLPGSGNVTNLMLVFLSGISNAKIKIIGNDYSFDYKNYYTRGSANAENLRIKHNRFYNNETYYYTILKKTTLLNDGKYTHDVFIEYKKREKIYIDLIRKNTNVHINEE